MTRASQAIDLGPCEYALLEYLAARSTPEHSGPGLALARAFAGALGLSLRAELVNERELAMTLEARNNA